MIVLVVVVGMNTQAIIDLVMDMGQVVGAMAVVTTTTKEHPDHTTHTRLNHNVGGGGGSKHECLVVYHHVMLYISKSLPQTSPLLLPLPSPFSLRMIHFNIFIVSV